MIMVLMIIMIIRNQCHKRDVNERENNEDGNNDRIKSTSKTVGEKKEKKKNEIIERHE